MVTSTQVILTQTPLLCTSNSRKKVPFIKGIGIHAFPEEIWKTIFSFVGAKDYPNLALVSRDIKRISTEALSNKLLDAVLRKTTLNVQIKIQVISWLSFYKNVNFAVNNLKALELIMERIQTNVVAGAALRDNSSKSIAFGSIRPLLNVVANLMLRKEIQEALQKQLPFIRKKEGEEETRSHFIILKEWFIAHALQIDHGENQPELIDPTEDPEIVKQYKVLMEACVQERPHVIELILTNPHLELSRNNNQFLRAAWKMRYGREHHAAAEVLLNHPRLDLSVHDNSLIKDACGLGDSHLVGILLKRPEVILSSELIQQLLIMTLEHLQTLKIEEIERIKLLKRNKSTGLVNRKPQKQRLEQEEADLRQLQFTITKHEQVMSVLIADPRIAAPLTEENNTPQVRMTDVLIRLCIEIQMDLTINDNYMIRFASKWGDVRLVYSILKDSNVDPSACNNQALKEALRRGHREIVDLLLEYSAVTGPLEAAEKLKPHAVQQKLELIRLLLAYGVTPSMYRSLLFRMACRYGDIENVKKWLTDPCVDPTTEGQQAIRVASDQGYTAIVRLLLGDPRIDPTIQHQEPIRLAASQGQVETIQALLEKQQVDPAAINNWGLRIASRNGHDKTVEFLIKHSKVNERIAEALAYALEDACQNGHPKVVEVLLRHPIIDPCNNNYRALYLAYSKEKESENFEMIKLLIRHPKVDLEQVRIWVKNEKLTGICKLISEFKRTAMYKRRKQS